MFAACWMHRDVDAERQEWSPSRSSWNRCRSRRRVRRRGGVRRFRGGWWKPLYGSEAVGASTRGPCAPRPTGPSRRRGGRKGGENTRRIKRGELAFMSRHLSPDLATKKVFSIYLVMLHLFSDTLHDAALTFPGSDWISLTLGAYTSTLQHEPRAAL